MLTAALASSGARPLEGKVQAGIIGEDNRRVIDQPGPPWAAVGQVNATGYRYAIRCTGTLIASDRVVTAAHCVMDPWRGTPFPLSQLHFLAGVRGSKWLGHSTAKCLHFLPEYTYAVPSKISPSRSLQRMPPDTLSRDVVVVVLSDPLVNVAPLELNREEVQGTEIALVHASYSAHRRHILTGHFGCRLLARDGEFWYTDCDTPAASSGGPILIQENGDYRLAAIMVGALTSASIAVPVSKFVDLIGKERCP
jgi:V8-like Glu-specific endopeptidase